MNFLWGWLKKPWDKVENEEIDRMYEEWRKETDPYSARDAEPESVSWEDATEDLGEMPESAQPDMEMELEP
jgi:hypothetical protein